MAYSSAWCGLRALVIVDAFVCGDYIPRVFLVSLDSLLYGATFDYALIVVPANNQMALRSYV